MAETKPLNQNNSLIKKHEDVDLKLNPYQDESQPGSVQLQPGQLLLPGALRGGAEESPGAEEGEGGEVPGCGEGLCPRCVRADIR